MEIADVGIRAVVGGLLGSVSSESNWPGLDVPAGVQEMDTDAMLEIADELQAILDDLLDEFSPGSRLDLQKKAEQAAGYFGQWDTAMQMQESYNEAHVKIMECYDGLLFQMDQAIRTLRSEAGEIEAVDQRNVMTVDVPGAGYPSGAGGTGDVQVTPGVDA